MRASAWLGCCIGLLAAGACRSAGSAAAPRPPAATAVAPADAPTALPQAAPSPTPLPENLRWVRRSAEYRALFLQTYRLAVAHVERAAAGRVPGSWAVVLDADETVISNAQFEQEQAEGQPYSEAVWSAWVKRRAAIPLPGAPGFLRRVRELGGRIAIVTNRSAEDCPDTAAVFQLHALPYDVMLCRPGPQGDKNPRFEAVAQGTTPAGLPPLEVLAFLGDNIQDFPRFTQAARKEEDSHFADFGARFFVLPNPMYGSWERNPD